MFLLAKKTSKQKKYFPYIFEFKTPTNSQFLIIVSLVFMALAALSAVGYDTFWGGTQHLMVAIMFAVFAVYAHQSEKK